MASAPRSLPATILVGLLLAVALSGCAGKAQPEGSDIVSSALPSPTLSSVKPPDEELKGVSDPKRHFHHYWGDRTEVDIFGGQLALQQGAFRGNEFGCPTTGFAEFDLETDGDQANFESPPVDPDTQRADTVFAGTQAIRVELVSKQLADNDRTQLFLHYKPANLNYYLPEAGCGIPLRLDQPVAIPVGPGQADPPHQWAVSRWSFLVLPATAPNDGTELPGLAQGLFDLKMAAINGGDSNLDPAHPNLWGDSLTYDLGCAENAAVPRQAVVWFPPGHTLDGSPAEQPPRAPLADIKLEYGRIVPLLTEKVTVTLAYEYTGPVAGTTVELWYYGADTNRYAPMEKVSDTEWQIVDTDQLKADPPYEDESLWRFMLVPRPPNQGPNGEFAGEFEGSYQICGTAHRDPSALLS